MVGHSVYVSSNLKDSNKLFFLLFLTSLLLSVLALPRFLLLSNTDIIRCFYSGHCDGILSYLIMALISIPLITYDIEHLSYLWAI